MIHKKRVLARPGPLNYFFEYSCSDDIGECHGANKKQGPHQSFFSKIESYEGGQKNIKRRPKNRVAKEGKGGIKKRVRPLMIQLHKKPFVPIIEFAPQRNCQGQTNHVANVSEEEGFSAE